VTLQNRADSASRPRCENSVEFSVIIPARDEEKMIGRCFERLAAMNFPAQGFEVVLIDNGSSDRTVEIAESWKDRLQVRVLAKSDGHNSALRNFGASTARGRFFAFLDADCLVPKVWLNFAVSLLSARGAGIVGAHCRIPPGSSWVATAWSDDGQANRRGNTSYVPSGDMLLQRDTFWKVGGFDESLETNEDYEFCQRAREAGFPVLCFSELEVIHLGTPQSLGSFYRQNRWHGRNVFRVFLSSLPRLRNVRPVLFALYTLFGIAAVVLGAFEAILKGWRGGLFVALGVFLAGPLALSLQKAYQRREVRLVASLFLLYLLYGLARASCLLPWSIWVRSEGHRRQRPRQTGAISDSVEGVRQA
jgi:glycosyltransferase involved in cell wall biosynthesis